MAYNDNVVFKTSTTATIDDLFTWNKSTGQITAKTDNIPIVPGTVYFTSDGHIVHDLAQNNRLWMSKNAYSAIYAEDVAETNTDIANAIKYSIHYVEGPTTDTTPGTWTGTINGITELYDGLTIIYVPAVAGGSSTTTLNINGLGAKTCYYSNTSAMTTHYSVGTPILLTYRNNCWRRADYNSNTTYSAMSVAEMRAGTATSERSIRADYLKTFLSTLGGTNLTLTHSNSAPYLQLNHNPSGITAGTYGNNSQQTPSYGGTFNIPYFTVDTQGHITNASVTTVKIPESDNTDYKVRQTSINSNDNNNYRILLSNSANDTSEDSVSKKNTNLIYNPTENKLSTGNIKLTGELDVTGNVYLRNQTTVDSLTAGSLIVNGNSTFNNDINLAQGAVKWTSNSLPSVTSANYFLVIDAFANGGATKYITKTDAIKSLISSSAIGSSTKPVYWTGSAFSAITSYSGAAALTGTPTAPTAAAGTSTTQIATTEFVTNAVAQGFIANDAMVFKGLIGSNQPITQLPTSGYNAGWTYRVANAGIFAGEYCEVGDLLIAIKDGPASGSSVINTDWGKVEHNIDGAVFRGSGASNSSVGSSTQPVYVNGSGIVTAITGAIANNTTGNAATATKVYSTHTYPTTKSYIEYQQDQATGSGNVNLRHHNALAVSSNMDTSSTNTKWTELQIGNTIASGAVGNSQGRIALCGSGSNYTQITTSGIGNNNYFYIPNYSGNGYAVTHSADTALGSTTQPIYLQANGRAAAVSWYPKYCTIDGWNTANYPWHRFATCTTGTSQYTDRDAIIVIYSRCKGGKYGIIRVSVRTNAINSSIDIEARWIFRQGFSVEDVRIAKTGNTTGIDTRIDVYVKCATYPRRYAYLLEGPNNGFNLINSNEARDTTADDKKTSVEAYEDVTTSVGYTAYNAVQSATDFGTVNHSNVTTGANLTTTANAVAYYTDVAGTFGSKASANGALYATSANGSLQWGTLPIAQGGTGATTTAAARTNLGLGSFAVKNSLNWNEITQSGADLLPEGNDDITDNTEFFTSYASNNGFSDTRDSGPGKVYRRDGIKIYNYIKTKAAASGSGFNISGTATNATQLISNNRMDYGWNGINYFNISTSNQSAAKVNDTPFSSNVWTHILRFNHNNPDGYYTDLAIPFNQNSIYYKRIGAGSLKNSTTNGGWIEVLDQLNYTSYTVTKTGSGASGTWNINISGNAATATVASKLQTARSLQVKLDSSSVATFDGSANQTAIPVSGTLRVTNGGTGSASSLVANKLIYSNSSTSMTSSSGLYTTGSNLAINQSSITDGNVFEVNGQSYFADIISNSEGVLSFVQNKIIVKATTDWNTLVTPGCYKVQKGTVGDSEVYHGPNETDSSLYGYGLLFVFKGASSDSEKRIEQIYFPHNSTHGIYRRMHNGSDLTTGWQKWYSSTHKVKQDNTDNTDNTTTSRWRKILLNGGSDNVYNTWNDTVVETADRVYQSRYIAVQPSSGTLAANNFIVNNLEAVQAVSTDANKKLVSTNLTTAEPATSGTVTDSDITYIARISQDAVGKISATKFTMRNATTTQSGVTKLNSATNNTSETEAATPKAIKSAYDLANNHKYWANVEATSAATYNKTPEVAKIKLNGNTSATAASTKNVQLIYDASLEVLNFVFS